jgi:hypothetical protein
MPDPELTPVQVTAEINRVKASVEALVEARRARKRAEGKEAARHSLEKRFDDYKAGRLIMCDCAQCLRAYILRTGPDHMCEKGQREFWRNTWQPWIQ